MILNLLPIDQGEISIANAAVTIASASYTGSDISLSSLLTVAYGGETLIESTDYALGGTTAATNAGTYTAVVVGKGDYSGTKIVTWSISKANVNAVKVTATWNGTPTTVSNPGTNCKFYNFPRYNTQFIVDIEAKEPITRIVSFDVSSYSTGTSFGTGTKTIDANGHLIYSNGVTPVRGGSFSFGAEYPYTIVWETQNMTGDIDVTFYVEQ